MNTVRLPVILLALSTFSLPCLATPEGQTIYTAKHKETAEKLAVQQDELQADTSDLIMGETNEEVVDLLKKCRHAMNDAVDLLENYNTGGPTLAAQSDVIELIYLAAKARMSMPGGGAGGKLPKFGENGMKPGSEALMNMLRQLLGMDSESQSMQQGESEGEGTGEGQGEGQNNRGNKPGKGADGKSDMASSQERGASNPDPAVESRSVPKSTGMSADDMPAEFRKALDAYNRTLQK